MRVAEHDDVAGVAREDELGRRPSELVAVADVNGHTFNRHDALPRQRGIVRVVDVAEDGVDRRNRFERAQHRCAADVARVKNPRHSVEHTGDLRPHQSVRIGDEADDLSRHRRSRRPAPAARPGRRRRLPSDSGAAAASTPRPIPLRSGIRCRR